MLNAEQLTARIDWKKLGGLVPAIVQDSFDGRVLMLGYMNPEAMAHTIETGQVTFWSRSRDCLWTKGETSGNTLQLDDLHLDCDQDCLLVMATPHGPTCHTGTPTCFDSDQTTEPALSFISRLEKLIAQREQQRPEGSYTTSLFEQGVKRIAQKVGEEGVETALAAVAQDGQELREESADLLYHLLVLLRSQNIALAEIVELLRQRHDGASS